MLGLFISIVTFAYQPPEKYLDIIVAAMQLTSAKCYHDKAYCSIAVLQKHDTPLFVLRQYQSFDRDLKQAYYNAVAGNMFLMRTNSAKFPGSHLENLQMLQRDRRVFNFPEFEYNNAGGPIYYKGHHIGALGLATDNLKGMNPDYYYDYFMKQYHYLLKHPKAVDRIIKQLTFVGHQKTSKFDDVELGMALRANKACHKMEIACSMTISDMYGTPYFHFGQINVPPVTVFVSKLRAATVATTLYPEQWHVAKSQRTGYHVLVGFKFLNDTNVMPITMGARMIMAPNRPVGGIGVSSFPKGASPINWLRNNKKLANILWSYLMKHYIFDKSCSQTNEVA